MSRRELNLVFTVFAALALALPIAARGNAAKDSKSTVTKKTDLSNPTTLAGKQLRPGTYDVKVDDSKVALASNGKVGRNC